MADIGASNWNATDASNTTAAPDGMPEGMAPSGVNDWGRAVQGALKRWWNKDNSTGTTAGTTTAYTLTYTVAAASYYDGEEFSFIVNATCGSAPTLNINSLGAKNLRKFTAGAYANLSAGDILANQPIRVRYNLSADKFDIVSAAGDYAKTADLTNQSITGPTVQNLTTGTAATYTTPAGVKWLKVRWSGAGGGGGGVGATLAPDGAVGGNTTFNSVVATGGSGGGGGTSFANTTGGIGGTGGTGTATLRVRGNQGGMGTNYNGVQNFQGGLGAGSPWFGGSISAALLGSAGSAGVAAAANTGAGGSGAGGQSGNASNWAAGGGGSGECAELIIINPSATYTYTIGAGGAGGVGTGTGAATGGAGGSGFITVEEHYNYG